MSKASDETKISQCKTIEALQNALDQTYRQLLEAAKADWQLLFAGSDPTDSCVSVRISKQAVAEELAGLPRAGFTPRAKNTTTGKFRPGMA
jgi:hypothetical protein